MPFFLFFDTETTGLPKSYKAPLSDSDNWPRCIQLAWQIHNEKGELIKVHSELINPENFNIPFEAEKVHGISTELAKKEGKPLNEVIDTFLNDLNPNTILIGHNLDFDIKIIGAECFRIEREHTLSNYPIIDTCSEETANLCKILGGKGGRFKLPKLGELHKHLFSEDFEEAHNATADVAANARCFFELVRTDFYLSKTLHYSNDELNSFKTHYLNPIAAYDIPHENLREKSNALKTTTQKFTETPQNIPNELKEATFAHLHNYSQYSILQSTSHIKSLISSAAKHNMPAVALTDKSNLMGAFAFINAAEEHNRENPEKNILPIIGCEFSVCKNHKDKTSKDNGEQIVLLAKNLKGYRNLCKLSSISYTQGFYYIPRIDKDLILEYKENLIALTGGLGGEISRKILSVGEIQAEETLLWWKGAFKSDLYIELIRHQLEEENQANQILISLAKKHNIKTIAANQNYYLDQEDHNAHDILLCIKDGERQSTPKGRGKGYRYGLPNNAYYFKSSDEMKMLFHDIPEAILNIKELISKISPYKLSRNILLPKFEIPKQFLSKSSNQDTENEYLKHLTYEGAKKRYPKLSEEIKNRLDFELDIIKKTGYPGYFLIVQDLITEARNIGVSVGPGRGSAAGSVVAYCLGITNIDPIKYKLLFERFLNPDRVSLPDIDIDFDDKGRSLVIDYVIKKYGANQVAQIITYGQLKGKSSIRDAGRVLELPLPDTDKLAKLLPSAPDVQLKNILNLTENEQRQKYPKEFDNIQKLLKIHKSKSLESETIELAGKIEGSLRNIGTHACGFIITPEDITNLVPITTAKDSNLYATQYDLSVVETAGLLKMDFLGLKTLSIIKTATELIKQNYQIHINPDEIPLDDRKTLELFQRGETIGIFQYESPGMQKHLISLKPDSFEDLIAMNALYRPGPIEYIPNFIKRKHGQEPVTYDLPEMEEYLKETYGITVYQEQVMLLSQKLANFSKGQADVLRKAMGKKQRAVLDKMKPEFIENGKTNGHAPEILEKIWKDWEAFAAYAFNKSHSTCYAFIAFQTAYLKAHYPEEFMASVLSHNMNQIDTVSFFLEEAQRMKIPVLGPCVNESNYTFNVNQNKAIRFGMGAIKGVGQKAVESIVEGRKEKPFESIFDLCSKVDLSAVNKKVLENLAMTGGFDCFEGTHRAQYMAKYIDDTSVLETAIRVGNKNQKQLNSLQTNLFGEENGITLETPKLPECEPWVELESLKKEAELLGLYISGHPLNLFSHEIKCFCQGDLTLFKEPEKLIGAQLHLAGIVSNMQERTSKNGNSWGIFKLEDFRSSHDFFIFGADYLKYKHFLVEGTQLFLKIKIVKDRFERVKTEFLNILLLQDILENFSKNLSLHLEVKTLTDQTLEDLTKTLHNNSGKKELRITLYDKSEQLSLNSISQGKKVSINKDLLDQLEGMNIPFSINT